MANKEQILELLNAYKSEVDNFNDAVFTDKFEVLAQDIVKLFAIPVVSNCSGFKEDDLSKAYQAGALETYAEEIQPLTYDAIKQVEQNSLAWIKRWKE